jgi:hypothetical protein
MESKPRLEPELVRQFVNDSHADFASVRDLLGRHPALINAAWDWGAGDWETGLGAAAHMGRKDIAHFLLERGARMDIFAAAMLGLLDIVSATITAVPEARSWLGPHGITLLRHAEVGGVEAAAVVDYLKSPAGP